MAKQQKAPIQRIYSGAALQAHIGGKKARQRQRTRRAAKALFSGALVLGTLAAGFLIMETMLRISEAPLQNDNVAAPVTTTQATTTMKPRPQGPPLQAFYVPLGMMDNREQSRQLMAQIAQAQTDTAVMLFKDSGGYLSYKSNLMQQSLLHASQRTRWRTDWTLYDLKNKAGQKIIGVVHCFDDPLAAGLMPNAAVLLRETNATSWKDAQGKAWLNPYSESAREYLLAIIREVCAFGADDILLCGVQFPAGNLEAAVFEGENAETPAQISAQRNGILRSFLKDAKAAAGEAKLYCLVPHAAVNGAEEYGGNLWDSAVDMIAVDLRNALLSLDETFWQTHPAVPLVESIDAANGAREYIVLQDEVLQARY